MNYRRDIFLTAYKYMKIKTLVSQLFLGNCFQCLCADVVKLYSASSFHVTEFKLLKGALVVTLKLVNSPFVDFVIIDDSLKHKARNLTI